ncbi:acyl-protein synthetase [Gammaproteobacteria bacterium 45_16_T64]|nr:acyl-protein synthetase [Gammaproteobacteria bacterium 45_16_T64]
MDIESYFQQPVFGLDRSLKNPEFNTFLNNLNGHHYDCCAEYRAIVDGLQYPVHASEIQSQLYLPVNIFKTLDLVSVPEEDVFKVMTSSGTSGGPRSKIYVDKGTARNQTKVLTKITNDFIGKKRLPMLVIDAEKTVIDRHHFTARTAAIKGFSMFGKKIEYALNEDMSLNFERIDKFFQQYGDEPLLIFGFTSLVYEDFVQALKVVGKRYSITQGIVVHGGGWKKLQDRAVDNITFKAAINSILGISRVHNYYGMIEQTGSIFFECERGYFHCSIFSHMITRRADFSLCDVGERGLIQLFSLLPGSYPGHSLLTEDIGSTMGEDDCSCGRHGVYFSVHGRAANAEIRGCSDSRR